MTAGLPENDIFEWRYMMALHADDSSLVLGRADAPPESTYPCLAGRRSVTSREIPRIDPSENDSE